MTKPVLIRIHDGVLSTPLGAIRLPKEVKWVDQLAIDTKSECVALSGTTNPKSEDCSFPKGTLNPLYFWFNSKWKKVATLDFFVHFGLSGNRIYFSDSSWLYVSDSGKAPERMVKCGIKSGGCPFTMNRSGTHFLAHTMQWRKGPICIDIKSKEYWELGQYGLWSISWFGNYVSSHQHCDFTVYKNHTFDDILFHADDLIAESFAINTAMEITPSNNRSLRDVIPSGRGAYFGYNVISPKFGGTMLCINHIDTAFKISHVGIFSPETYQRSFVTYGKSGFAQRYWKDNTLIFPDGRTLQLQEGEFVMPSDYSMRGHGFGLNIE